MLTQFHCTGASLPSKVRLIYIASTPLTTGNAEFAVYLKVMSPAEAQGAYYYVHVLINTHHFLPQPIRGSYAWSGATTALAFRCRTPRPFPCATSIRLLSCYYIIIASLS